MGSELFLIVDDDSLFGIMFSRLCDGIPTQIAVTIAAGLLLANKISPTHIFLDVRFDGPWETGIDAIPKFLGLCPEAKVVVMTAYPNEYERRLALEAGAYAYVEKPGLLRARDVSLSLVRAHAADRRRFLSSLPGPAQARKAVR